MRAICRVGCVSLCLSVALLAGEAQSGGGPENVFLVVNAKSVDSMTVANHYIVLRHIPPSNVFYLPFPPDQNVTSGATFKTQILEPILKEIDKRKLSQQIDYIVYSCDFPWRLDFSKMFPGEKFGREATPTLSLTGATYLSAFVQADRKEMLNLGSNLYSTPFNQMVVVSRAFRSQYRWGPGGRRLGNDGLPYMLSAMLGVKAVPGNTVDEMIWYLKRAAGADGTAPKGTIYFAKNADIRSTVRDKEYPAAVRLLELAGVNAEIVEGAFPQNKAGMAGVTSGNVAANPAGSKSTLLPGAFCDNLTSSGGVFLTGHGQTCLSEFLRLGAAGACGTVTEPLALPQKFPNASCQVHYVHGCSLAESFYQSVAAPFQQILVGDPLCQPWAKIPRIKVQGLEDKAAVRGKLEFSPLAEHAENGIANFKLFIDGVSQQTCRPGEKFTLDSTTLADGYHELRVVGVDNTPIETQGSWQGSIMVKNGADAIQLSVSEKTLSSDAAFVELSVFATSDVPVQIFCNSNLLGTVPTGTGHLAVAKEKLGTGPVTLIGISEGKPAFRANPLSVDIRFAVKTPAVPAK